jgi:hypothetical protein
MPIFHHLTDGQDRGAEIIQLAQPVPNFLASFPACSCSDEPLQFGAVLPTRSDGRKPVILEKIISAHETRYLRPNRITHFRHTQGKIPVSHL